MVARNPITGDAIQTKPASKAYHDNYDNIFRKNKKTESEKFDEQVVMKEEFYDLDEEDKNADKSGC